MARSQIQRNEKGGGGQEAKTKPAFQMEILDVSFRHGRYFHISAQEVTAFGSKGEHARRFV
jgi:hypothetical protein